MSRPTSSRPVEFVSWNPVTGCTQVSAGCDHCYALRIAERSRGVAGHPYEQGFDLRLWPERLDHPLHWRTPRRVFVNSMSDLFHAGVPDAFIFAVFERMRRAPWHEYMVLTKRPRRLAKLADRLPFTEHTWIGVSIESNEVAWRADALRRVPCAVRMISAEPLIGPLDALDLTGIDLVSAGGETGPIRRPCEPAWARDLRDACLANDVAFTFRKWGGATLREAGGRELDGVEWRQRPAPKPERLLYREHQMALPM